MTLKEIDRYLSRPARFPIVLFWAVILGLFLLWPQETTQAEPPAAGETITIPMAVAEAQLRKYHAALERIEKQDKEIARLTFDASACAANFGGMHRPAPFITKE